MKNKLIIKAGCSFVIVMLLSLMVMSNWQMKQLAIYEQEQNFTFNVIQSLDHLSDILREARKGQRDFSRSGEEKYLQSYNNALKDVGKGLVLLNMMARPYSWLQKRVAVIELQVKEQLADFDRQIMRGTESSSQSAADKEIARLKRAELRHEVAAAKEDAVNRMRLLTARQERDFKEMQYLLILNSIIICILIITIYFLSRRELTSRIRMNEHVVMLQEKERLSLSREVHDDIGQNLTALKLDLALIESKLADGNGELAERLTEMRANLDQLLAKTHDITAKLRPPLLDNLGLAAAIEWQVNEFKRLSGIEFHLMLNDEIRVADQHVGLAIMRIFQEALTNVVRHARATEVSVSMCRREDDFILEISDNGCGITTKEMDSLKAYGIMGMRERASLCNGKMTISGDAGSGTTLTLAIPSGALKEEI